ncbi:hypothetical protein E2320_015751, partial [Naja naja]
MIGFGSRETLTSPRKGAAGKRSSLTDKPRRGTFLLLLRASQRGKRAQCFLVKKKFLPSSRLH